jgi:hypothetical protein
MNDTKTLNQFVKAMNSKQPRNVVLQPEGKFIQRCGDWNAASVLAAQLQVRCKSPNAYYACYTDREARKYEGRAA